MGNKKGYEIYTSSQNQVLFLTPLFGVFYEKKMRQLICSHFTTDEVPMHYEKEIAKLEST